MPYIAPEERNEIDELIEGFAPVDGGELQYAIAALIHKHYQFIQWASEDGVRYKNMEAVMGALSGAAMEHYRCVVAPYEEKKIKENGAVYGQYNSKSY